MFASGRLHVPAGAENTAAEIEKANKRLKTPRTKSKAEVSGGSGTKQPPAFRRQSKLSFGGATAEGHGEAEKGTPSVDAAEATEPKGKTTAVKAKAAKPGKRKEIQQPPEPAANEELPKPCAGEGDSVEPDGGALQPSPVMDPPMKTEPVPQGTAPKLETKHSSQFDAVMQALNRQQTFEVHEPKNTKAPARSEKQPEKEPGHEQEGSESSDEPTAQQEITVEQKKAAHARYMRFSRSLKSCSHAAVLFCLVDLRQEVPH